MSPGIRRLGRGIEVVLETTRGGLNPLRGPSAALAALLNVTAATLIARGMTAAPYSSRADRHRDEKSELGSDSNSANWSLTPIRLPIRLAADATKP